MLECRKRHLKCSLLSLSVDKPFKKSWDTAFYLSKVCGSWSVDTWAAAVTRVLLCILLTDSFLFLLAFISNCFSAWSDWHIALRASKFFENSLQRLCCSPAQNTPFTWLLNTTTRTCSSKRSCSRALNSYKGGSADKRRRNLGIWMCIHTEITASS